MTNLKEGNSENIKILQKIERDSDLKENLEE